MMRFLPTPSVRRATYGIRKLGLPDLISTHALREEGDAERYLPQAFRHRFLPTPSARRATRTAVYNTTAELFLPTPSARRATGVRRQADGRGRISTHALREEGDVAVPRNRAVGMQFLPTPSARRATARSHRSPPSVIISTHALREEGDPAGPPVL